MQSPGDQQGPDGSSETMSSFMLAVADGGTDWNSVSRSQEYSAQATQPPRPWTRIIATLEAHTRLGLGLCIRPAALEA
jgi:hypothetical protein